MNAIKVVVVGGGPKRFLCIRAICFERQRAESKKEMRSIASLIGALLRCERAQWKTFASERNGTERNDAAEWAIEWN